MEIEEEEQEGDDPENDQNDENNENDDERGNIYSHFDNSNDPTRLEESGQRNNSH